MNSRSSYFACLLMAVFLFPSIPLADVVTVSGRQILLDNTPYLIKGVCYHPVPKGSVKRSFQSLSKDLALMQRAGINTLRVYEPIQSQSVLDEINAAGIKVIIGFGYDQGGKYDIKSGTFADYIRQFKDHDAILLWELGNEYNYHPEWFDGDVSHWYEIMNAAAREIHRIDPGHPVSTAHGELPDRSIVKGSPDIDVWGVNLYRWDTTGNIHKEWQGLSDKPLYLSEAGGDSFMTTTAHGYKQGQNQRVQADALTSILIDVFENQDILSGVTLFAFVDEWWKAGNPALQDAGGWAPNSGGVPYDGTANEEYWGIVDIERNPKEAFNAVAKILHATPQN